MNKLNQIFTILKLTVTILVVGLAVLLMLTVLPIRGNVKILTVLSGSMEPAIKTGSVVIIKNDNFYRINDVVTFTRPGTKELVTHRISAIKYEGTDRIVYTKGDNNEELDTWTITNQAILGKVLLTVPWLGYIQQWLRTPIGFVVAVVLPASIIIYGELINIRNEIWKFIQKKRVGKIVIVALLVILTIPIIRTEAFMFDLETSNGNVVGVATDYDVEPLDLLEIETNLIDEQLISSDPMENEEETEIFQPNELLP